MSKSIKEHMAEADSVKKIVDDANGLLMKARDELATAREVLTELRVYQHPKLMIDRRSVPHMVCRVADCGENNFPPLHLIDKQISRINALLGDRP